MGWNKGRGKLGRFKPLLGSWQPRGDSAMGPLTCTRHFELILNNKWLSLRAVWTYDDPKRDPYEEHCLIGAKDKTTLGFYSFISDGSHSEGILTEATDVHPEALCFEAEMPHGRARQIYSAGADGALLWQVERRVKAGWSPIVTHTYLPL